MKYKEFLMGLQSNKFTTGGTNITDSHEVDQKDANIKNLGGCLKSNYS
jgi:hypothetical protein